MSGQKAAAKQEPDDAASEPHVDEKTPLKAEEKGAGGIDAEKLLAESLKIRLPRMDKEMQFGYPAERQKKGKGALKKESGAKSDAKKVVGNEMKKAQDEATAAAKKEAYEAAKEFLPDGKIPTRKGLTRWLKKYLVDFITNSLYGGVGIVLTVLFSDQVSQAAQAGSAVSAANATGVAVKAIDVQNHLESLENQTHAAMAQAQQAVADVQTQVVGLENKLTEYWVLVAGCVSSILMIMKNVRFIVRSFYDLIDKIEDKINDGIDVLQKELEEDVTEVLQDATEAVADDQMSAMGRKVMVTGVVNKLRTAIDDAQEQIPEQLNSLLPWVARVKCRLISVLAGPCVLVVAAKCAWDVYVKFISDTGTGARRLDVDWTNSTSLQVDFVAELEDHLNLLYPMFVTLFLNFLFAVFSSDPIVRLMTNTAIRLIERATNWFILKIAKEKVPLDEIQMALDTLALGSGFNMKSMRQCTKNCSPGECTMQ